MTGARRSPGTPLCSGRTIFRAVVGLSVPFRPRGNVRPTSAMPQTDQSLFYQLYFQTPGVAEAELERDPRRTVRSLLYSGSGDAPPRADNALSREAPGMVPRNGGFLTRTIDPPALPAWLSEKDIDFYAAEFARTGFRSGLNWYRNIDRNWELMAAFRRTASDRSGALRGGRPRSCDLVCRHGQTAAESPKFVPDLRGATMLPGCGHWTQQERAEEVNSAILGFLRDLP